MSRVAVSGAAAASWLAALALSRHGIAGGLSAEPPGEGRVSLAPSTLARLRQWGVLADDVAPVIAESELLRETRRRVRGYGLFAECSEADAPLAIHAGDGGAGICIGAEVNAAVANLMAICWRVAGSLRGWYQGPLGAAGDDRFDDPRLHRHFDVKLVVVADAALTGAWEGAIARHAHHVPLDLVTVGAGGRVAEAVPLPGAGGALIGPGGEILAEWTRMPRDPEAALAGALIATGISPGVLR